MKKVKILVTTLLTTVACFALMSVSSKAAPFQDERFSFAQPDKTEVEVIGTGDEYYQHIETPDGYTLIRNDDNWICYADLNEDGTELVATDTVYNGSSDNVPEGLEKHLDITQESVDKKIKEAKEELNPEEEQGKKSSPLLKLKSASIDNYKFNTKTEVTGLTIMVDFKDVKSKFSVQDVEDFMNKQGYSEFGNNGSVHDYFYDISNGMLDYKNKIIRVQVSGNKEDYDKSKIDNGSCARKLINEINGLISQNNLEGVTKKDDGSFSIVNILYAGSCSSGWAEGLWPHKSDCSFNGKSQVYQMTDLGNQLSLGTICHETGHALLDYPDLYSYTNMRGKRESGPSIVGNYCLMGRGNKNEGGKNPAPPNPYLRYIISGFKGNVFNFNSVDENKVVSLKSNPKGNADVYKWANPNKRNEYYLLENIQNGERYGKDIKPGLIVWHIDQSKSNYDVTSKEYEVSIIDAKDPSDYLGCTPFRSDINDTINIVSTPNATWNKGNYSGLKISNISDSKEEMTFQKGSTVTQGLYNKGGYIYYVTDKEGNTLKGFNDINSKKYYFDPDTGYAKKGVYFVDGDLYYSVEETGEVVEEPGFVDVGDKTYYVTEDQGKLARELRKIDNKTYYFNSMGQLAKGLECVYINGKWEYRYFDKNTGEMKQEPGVFTADGDTYYVINEDGELAEGYQQVGNDKYYFGRDDKKAYKGMKNVREDDKWHYNFFDETTGVMKCGFVDYNGDTYYYDEHTYEKVKNCWFNKDGITYHLDVDGKVAKGIKEIYGELCYFGEDGVYDKDKKGLVFEGNYKVIEPEDYNLDCKNQVTLGKPISFKAVVFGEEDQSKITYSYTASYRALAAPADEFTVPDDHGNIAEFEFEPKTEGYCMITVTAKNKETGKEYSSYVIVETHSKLEAVRFMVDNKEANVLAGEEYVQKRLSHEADIKILTEGGYTYEDMKYTFEIFKEGGDKVKDKEVYVSNSPELKWKPKEKGVYSINVKVEDKLGNIAEKCLCYNVY